MSETIIRDALVLERRLPHTPERVWQVLTDPVALGRWLMPNDFAPIRGHRFTFHATRATGWDGLIHCVVLDVDPPRLLRYSWVSNGPGAPLDSIVRWTLTPAGKGTLLRMEHSGFGPQNADAYAGFSQGWPEKLDALERVAAG